MYHDLQVCQIEGQKMGCDSFYSRYLLESFQLWFDVWAETFLSLESRTSLRSDDFTRQDEILGIWHKKQCIALVCHRFVNLQYSYNQMDSYFQSWPPHCLDELKKRGNHLAIGSQITIHPAFRKTGTLQINPNMNIKNLISYLSLYSLSKNRAIDLICGTMRSDKGMNQLFYKSGAKPIATNIIYHNVPVDLVVFEPRLEDGIIIPSEYLPLVTDLWRNRIVAFPVSTFQKENNLVA